MTHCPSSSACSALCWQAAETRRAYQQQRLCCRCCCGSSWTAGRCQLPPLLLVVLPLRA